MDLKGKISYLIDKLNDEIDKEYSNFETNVDKQIVKQAYCYGLQKCIVSLEDILESEDN